MRQLELMFAVAGGDLIARPQHVSMTRPLTVSERSSRETGSPAGTFPPQTIAELIEQLRRHPKLAPRRLHDIISALRKICHLAGKTPDLVPATATQIRTIFAGSSPITAGIGKMRWCNMRSLALRGLRHAGLLGNQSPTREPLSLAWDALRDRLCSIEPRARLSRFMSYCSAQQIDPPQVTDATFKDFADTLRNSTFVEKPDQIFRKMCQVWNAAVADIEGWPPIVATAPVCSHRYAFDLTAFPETFQADVAAFLACTGNQDPFADDYAPSVKPSTIAMRRKQIAQMATALAKSGIAIEGITRLASLIEPGSAKPILRFLRDRHGSSFTYLHQQALLLKTIARYWVNASPADIETISRFARNLATKRQAMTPKNARRLRQFDIDQNIRALLDLPDRILTEVGSNDCNTQRDARRLMLAVAVGLLTVTAMRIDNLASLEPSRHLRTIRCGETTVTLLVIPAEETKTGKSIEAQLSPGIERLLTTYQRHYLPCLAANPGAGLFLSRSGERCRASSLAVMVCRFIKRETGLEVNVHLFRHIAAKLVLEDNSANIETVRQLLGHSSTTTTARAYAELKTAPAYKLYGKIVAGRDGSRLPIETGGSCNSADQ